MEQPNYPHSEKRAIARVPQSLLAQLGIIITLAIPNPPADLQL